MQYLKKNAFVIAALAALFGIWLFQQASKEKRLAAQVETAPTSIDYQELDRKGLPDNRHLRVTHCWFGWGYTYRRFKDNNEWNYTYVPMYPSQVAQEDGGRSVRLIARLSSVRNEQELDQVRAKTEITGCIWGDHQIAPCYQEVLREYYPQIDFELCRVIHVGDPLPTPERARMFLLGAMAALIVSVVLASCYVGSLVGKWFDQEKDPKERDPFASDLPGQQLMPQARPPSALTVLWLRCANHALPAAVVCGVLTYLAMRLGFVPAVIGHSVIWACVATSVVFGGSALLATSKFYEYEHERLEPHQLPKDARRHIDRHTLAIEQLGFRREGDFRISWIANTTSRRFLSFDQRTLAYICHNSIVSAVSFQSVTSDGVKHETSTFDASEMMDASLPYRQQVVTGSPAELLAAHQQWVQLHETTHQVETLTVEPEQISTVVDYGHRVLGWSHYRKGVHDAPPPPLPKFNSIEMLSNLLKRGGMPLGAAGCR